METERLRASGFKRILVRLDEGTRRKYCCRALEEDLQRARGCMDACTAAMAQAKQVQDATRQLEASPRAAAVSAELLGQLEALLGQLGAATDRLQDGDQDGVKGEALDEHAQARTLARQILQTQDAETASAQIKKLERLMPVLQDVDDKQQKWWKKHVQRAVLHAVELQDGDEHPHATLRLTRTVKKVAAKCPDLQDLIDKMTVEAQPAATQEKETETTQDPATKRKRKRAIALPDDGETAVTTAAASAKPKAKSGDKEKKGEPADKARALLHRCSKEVRTLRDKFELGAFDVNLSRMVTVVDSLWPGFGHSDVVALTTALFTLVEMVEKVVNQAKHRDRLVCLESVLGVVLGTTKLQLTARRKTMVEEYAENCRQSLEQLNRPTGSAKQPASNSTEKAAAPTPSPATAPTPSPATAPTHTTKAARGKQTAQTAWPKSHVRFS